MADRVIPGPVSDSDCIREAVCIDTRKIYDSCRDKDCVEDLRVYTTLASRPYIDSAFSIRPRNAELLLAQVNVNEISFNRGYYTVDLSFFYRITGETFPAGDTVTGLAVFDKRVMLFGSEGSVKSFSSGTLQPILSAAELPTAVVDAVDPIILNMRISDADAAPVADADPPRDIPQLISDLFVGELDLTGGARRLFVTLGQFSIVRLERDTQLLIPAYDYCLPDKECQGSTEDDPCTMFSRIRFPGEEFFPPDSIETNDDYRSMV